MDHSPERTSPLIDAVRLGDLLRTGAAPVLLDVQWTLGRDDGRERYLEAHLPGARFVDLDRELAAPASPERGRHPLPDRTAFQALLRRLGVHADSDVVVYDQAQGFGAARLWWLLRFAGLAPRVLDGGLAAWRRAGYDVAAGEVTDATPSDLEIDWQQMPLLSIDDAAAFPDRGVLLDARAGERYRGESEPMDPRAGHIPGAVSAPTTGNLDENGQFLPATVLRERFAALGASGTTAVGAYCGSGITAAHEVLALQIAGLDGALFPGSWSQWSNDPARPAAIGATPR